MKERTDATRAAHAGSDGQGAGPARHYQAPSRATHQTQAHDTTKHGKHNARAVLRAKA